MHTHARQANVCIIFISKTKISDTPCDVSDITILLLGEAVETIYNADDNTDDDENAKIAGAHDGQCFQKQIYTHDFNLPLKQDQWQP